MYLSVFYEGRAEMWLWIKNNFWETTWTIVYIAYFWNKLPNDFLGLAGVVAIWVLGLYVISHWKEWRGGS